MHFGISFISVSCFSDFFSFLTFPSSLSSFHCSSSWSLPIHASHVPPFYSLTLSALSNLSSPLIIFIFLYSCFSSLQFSFYCFPSFLVRFFFHFIFSSFLPFSFLFLSMRIYLFSFQSFPFFILYFPLSSHSPSPPLILIFPSLFFFAPLFSSVPFSPLFSYFLSLLSFFIFLSLLSFLIFLPSLFPSLLPISSLFLTFILS